MGSRASTLTGVKSVFTFCHNIYVHKAHQEFSPYHLAEEEVFFPVWNMSFLSDDSNEKILFGILNFSKNFVIMYLIQQNATLMWYHSHKRHLLQELTVSDHHQVTAWTAWYQQLFYWNWNTNRWGGDCSAKKEELADWSLLQELSLDRFLWQLGHWIQYPYLQHLHLHSIYFANTRSWQLSLKHFKKCLFVVFI